MNNRFFQIAIDGPVAAGKSTAAKRLSQKLNYLYVDSGAMYRALALKAKNECVQWVDEAGVVDLLSTLEIELDTPNGDTESDGRLVTILLDGKDVSHEIRTPLIGEGASIVSTYLAVREVLVDMQRNIASGKSVVMEGRDIGSVVLPNANLKIYMDANVATRVERKWQFLQNQGINQTKAEVKVDLEKRDNREKNRKNSPLKPTHDAWIMDTSNTNIEEVVDKIIERIKSL